MLLGLPLNDYTAFHVLDEGKINGGRYFDPIYLPSTLLAYLQPGGLRLTSLFPYITLPAGPTRVVGGVLFDNRTRTASVTASMPLLFVLSCLGVVSAFRRRAGAAMTMLRILLVASAAGTAAVLFYGWIANRYLADFLPFLVIASAIGAVALWHRLEGRARRTRVVAFVLIAGLGVFGVVANVALSITPTDAWTTAQASGFLQTQDTLSNLTGHPLKGQIMGGHSLPYWAPADTVFIAGHCDALYVSNGEDYRGVLDQRAEHRTWVLVEEGAGFQHTLNVTFRAPNLASNRGRVLATMGQGTVLMHSVPAARGYLSVWFTVQDPRYGATSVRTTVVPGSTHGIAIQTDRYRDVVTLTMDDNTYLEGPITTNGLPTLHITTASSMPAFTINRVRAPAPSTPLCRTLSSGR